MNGADVALLLAVAVVAGVIIGAVLISSLAAHGRRQKLIHDLEEVER